MEDREKEDDLGPVELPIDGVLDLHMFEPRDAGDLIRDYLGECRSKGILEVRIIHGKGTGAMRETVHSLLDSLPFVESYRLAGGSAGGWGATIAVLSP